MNLGQTLITTGMLVLLIMSIISANRMLMEVNQATFESEAMTAAATIANDLFDEILAKKFDKWSDTTGTQDPSSFSYPTSGSNEWGPSQAEKSAVGPLDSSYVGNYKSMTYFNDVDDYIGYKRMVAMNSISGFIVTVDVYYVNSYDPDTRLTSQNTYKKIEVIVDHPLYLQREPPLYPPKAKYTALASY